MREGPHSHPAGWKEKERRGGEEERKNKKRENEKREGIKEMREEKGQAMYLVVCIHIMPIW